jgi:hypothetical protein
MKNLTTVADNVFDHQNNFHEDRLSFPVYGENISLGNFRPFFEARRTKISKFLPKLSCKS